MLDPPAPVTLVAFRKLFDRSQHFGIGGVTDGVHGTLEIVHAGAAHQIAQLRRREQRQTLRARIVVIGCLEHRPARTERAVEKKLDPAHPQAVVIEPAGRLRPGNQFKRLEAVGIGHDPDLQPPAIAGAAEGAPVGHAGAHVGDRGHALGQQHILRLGEGEIAVLGAGRGNDLAHQGFRIVDKHARRRALGIADDLAARRIGRLGGDACGGDGQRVAPVGVIIRTFQPHRAIGHHGVKLGGGGEAAKAPLFLIPSAPENPRTARIVLRKGLDLRQRVLERSGVRQVERERAKADIHHVDMGVDHPGDQHAALAVEPVIDLRTRLAAREHGHNLAILVKHEAGEALDLAFLANRHAVDIIDQRIGQGRDSQRKERGGGERRDSKTQFSHPSSGTRRGRRVMSAEVSLRPPPAA